MRLWKIPWIQSVFALIFLVIDFVFHSRLIFTLLTSIILLDGATGVTAALKRKEKITSWRLSRAMLEKFLAYGSVLLLMAGLDFLLRELVNLGPDFQTGLHSLAIGWVFAVEAISVLENSQFILGIDIPFLRSIKIVKKVISEKVDQFGKANTEAPTDQN